MVSHTLAAKADEQSIIKPGELIDIVELSPLTLNDRRIYNLLLGHAWDDVARGGWHEITKRELRGSHNVNDRVGESIERLMGAIVKVRVTRDGEPSILRVQLLAPNSEHVRPDGVLRYRFPPELREIILNSSVFARLHREVMLQLSSKYALTLYEVVQKRGNLRHRSSEIFGLDDFRALLGVPDGKLTSWINFRNKAVTPALKEVNALSEFDVEIEPIKEGRKIVRVQLRWERKDPHRLSRVQRELDFSKVGRKARMDGTVETAQASNDPQGIRPLDNAIFEQVRREHPGYDPYYIEAEWRRWLSRKDGAPSNPEGSFITFCRKYVKEHPV